MSDPQNEKKPEEQKPEEGAKEAEKKPQEQQKQQGKPKQPQQQKGGGGGGKKGKKGKESAKNTWLKTPKGTRDYEPRQMKIREMVIETLKTIFKKHGAVTIETPVFELKDTLTGKYGEDSKLIYDLADQGGELCALRYDLTVPFARYVATHSVESIKRYHIGRVYRRDQPAMTKGRYREFYQCDFDIAGEYDVMIPEAEIFKVMTECLSAVDVGEFVVKVNHRGILDGLFEFCGVPEDKFRPICSAVDKLDKLPWEEVKKEMVEVKGLSEEAADKLSKYVLRKNDPFTLYEELTADEELMKNERMAKAMEEMKLLFTYLKAYKCYKYVSFDMSLARGLDYYTGVIYEAVLVGAEVGSVAGGGRYDNLVGIFGSKTIPAVGFSVGIERLFGLLEEKYKNEPQTSETQVLVASFDRDMLPERMAYVAELWENGISAEILMKSGPKIQPQLKYGSRNHIPYSVILSKQDLEKGEIAVKNLDTGKQEMIPKDNLIPYLKEQLKQGSSSS
mmetsp:Transcript_11227/g.16990  ORF Transcript_11227/g.16990 Transcript_11227/m.16990 type:complete len:505 (-) Transcript_11227:54-1568(-)